MEMIYLYEISPKNLMYIFHLHRSEQKDTMSLDWYMNVRYNYHWFSIYSLILDSDTSPIVEQKYPLVHK